MRRRREHLLRSCTLNRQPAAFSPPLPPADPTPPPPPEDPTAVADRIVEHLIERLRAPQSVEPSPPDILHPHLRPRCHHGRRAPQCRASEQRRRPGAAKAQAAEQEQQQSEPISALETPPSRRAPRWLMTSGGSFRNGNTRPNVSGSINAKSASSSPKSPNLGSDWSRI